MNDSNSLAHTKWNCKYHIVFAPKYRRQIIYGELKKEIGKILRELCVWKQIEIIEAEACKDHIHMCIKIPPKYSVSSIIGFLSREKCKKDRKIYPKSDKIGSNIRPADIKRI